MGQQLSPATAACLLRGMLTHLPHTLPCYDLITSGVLAPLLAQVSVAYWDQALPTNVW